MFYLTGHKKDIDSIGQRRADFTIQTRKDIDSMGQRSADFTIQTRGSFGNNDEEDNVQKTYCSKMLSRAVCIYFQLINFSCDITNHTI